MNEKQINRETLPELSVLETICFKTNGVVQIHTEDSGGLLQNFFQLLLAPAGHGPLQVPSRTLGHSPGHLFHHELSREPGGSEDHQVVRPVRGCFYTRHSDSKQVWRSSAQHLHLSRRLTAESRSACSFDSGFFVYFRSNIMLIS